jgi:hypothetical protein
MGDIYGEDDSEDVHHHLTDVLDQIENDHTSRLVPPSLREEDNVVFVAQEDVDGHDMDMGCIYDDSDDDCFAQSAMDVESSTSADADSEAVKRSFRTAPRGSSSNLLAFQSHSNVSFRISSQSVSQSPDEAVDEMSVKDRSISTFKRGHLNVLTHSSSMSDIMSPAPSTSSIATSTTSRMSTYSFEGTNPFARKGSRMNMSSNSLSMAQRSSSSVSNVNANSGNSSTVPLQPFLSDTVTQVDVAPIDSNSPKFDIPVRDRFLHAKREQERIEKERMNKLRSRITPHNFTRQVGSVS